MIKSDEMEQEIRGDGYLVDLREHDFSELLLIFCVHASPPFEAGSDKMNYLGSALVFIFVFKAFDFSPNQDFTKFERITCNSSGKTATPICSLKLYRYTSLLSVDCPLKRTLVDKIMVDFEVHHRRVGKYRQLINLKNLDVCFVMKQSEMFPVLYPTFDWLNGTFPGLVHQCPYSELKIVNASASLGLDTKIMTKSALTFPNGFYNYKIKYHDEIDDNIGSADILLVLRERSRDVEF